MKRFAYMQRPGFWGAAVAVAVFDVHALVNRPIEPDLLSAACLVLILISGGMCFVGTIGRIDKECDGEPVDH